MGDVTSIDGATAKHLDPRQWQDGWVNRLHTAADAQQWGAVVDAAQRLAEGPGAQKTERTSLTPDDVLKIWHAEGPLIHEPTGFAQLDAMTGGGPVYGSRWFLIGAPDAGKTLTLLQIADAYLERGLAVGVLAIDEEPGDLLMRLAQRRGFSREECERRDVETMTKIATATSALRVRFYDHEWTIDEAAEDLASYANELGTKAFLGIDSLQTATSSNEDPNKSLREHVTQRALAVRHAATRHRMIVMATSEMNRGAYRSIDAAEQTNDMAAAKESGAIEYVARVMLSLRSVAGEKDLIELSVTKNKHGASGGKVGLRLDRDRQCLSEVDGYDPDAIHEAQREARDAAKRRARRESTLADAAALACVLVDQPGLTLNKTHKALRAALESCGRPRFEAAADALGHGLVTVTGGRDAAHHYIDGTQVPDDVLTRLEPSARAKVGNARPPSEGGNL